jgi:hypothetical protein
MSDVLWMKGNLSRLADSIESQAIKDFTLPMLVSRNYVLEP